MVVNLRKSKQHLLDTHTLTLGRSAKGKQPLHSACQVESETKTATLRLSAQPIWTHRMWT